MVEVVDLCIPLAEASQPVKPLPGPETAHPRNTEAFESGESHGWAGPRPPTWKQGVCQIGWRTAAPANGFLDSPCSLSHWMRSFPQLRAYPHSSLTWSIVARHRRHWAESAPHPPFAPSSLTPVPPGLISRIIPKHRINHARSEQCPYTQATARFRFFFF